MPPWSILSVTLFVVAINRHVFSPKVTGDASIWILSIFTSGYLMFLVERKLLLAPKRISHWADGQGFRLYPSKTVAMYFCHLRGVHPDQDLHFYGGRISCVEVTRFLGMIFDTRLTWSPHLGYIEASCLMAMDLLKVFAHCSWGADSRTLLVLHRSLILPKLEKV